MCLLLFFLVFIPITSFSQLDKEQFSSPELFVSFGPGFSIAGPGQNTIIGGGLCLRGEASVVLYKMIFSGYAAINTGGKSDYSGLFSDNLHDEFSEIGGKIGWIEKNTGYSKLYFSGGLCLLQGRRVYAEEDGDWFGSGKYVKSSPTIGIPLEIGWNQHKRVIGYGFSMFMNLNPEEIFGGITINFLLGRFNYQPRIKA